eukprot:1608951-Prymnesium_polylepis.1
MPTYWHFCWTRPTLPMRSPPLAAHSVCSIRPSERADPSAGGPDPWPRRPDRRPRALPSSPRQCSARPASPRRKASSRSPGRHRTAAAPLALATAGPILHLPAAAARPPRRWISRFAAW